MQDSCIDFSLNFGVKKSYSLILKSPKLLYTLQPDKNQYKMPDLNSYIKNLEKQGYDIRTIKATLLRYGYPEDNDM